MISKLKYGGSKYGSDSLLELPFGTWVFPNNESATFVYNGKEVDLNCFDEVILPVIVNYPSLSSIDSIGEGEVPKVYVSGPEIDFFECLDN